MRGASLTQKQLVDNSSWKFASHTVLYLSYMRVEFAIHRLAYTHTTSTTRHTHTHTYSLCISSTQTYRDTSTTRSPTRPSSPPPHTRRLSVLSHLSFRSLFKRLSVSRISLFHPWLAPFVRPLTLVLLRRCRALSCWHKLLKCETSRPYTFTTPLTSCATLWSSTQPLRTVSSWTECSYWLIYVFIDTQTFSVPVSSWQGPQFRLS